MSTRTLPDPSTPAPGSEGRYVIGDYALAAVEVLGAGWGGDYGYLGGSGLIWGPNVPTLRLALDDEEDLVIYRKDDPFATRHLVELPDGAPGDKDDLRKVGKRLALLIVNRFVN
ncbi:hypothetical protein OHS33_39110 (plasmid) [Streptomyces sp. NBC_00536]|uniref:hypothetical protein n=1 Tax=Streptomyces sp. NBC_00536 TaxID=2975769 RepID=UPI002E8201EA|nr:hypothetical protein [Streptomyces sp. NBC_00536]WUC84369.1 hypothetical protein OHS33_39110 [Streptomyces sp. NBC_00536]